jgi:hypothetical protein
MSDPRYNDPRTQPPLQDDAVLQDNLEHRRAGELQKSNAMWGWVAGGIVLALLLVFVFGRTPATDQASNQMTAPPPGQTTLSPPTSPPTPPTAQRPAASTTGQGGGSSPAATTPPAGTTAPGGTSQ